jgi:hypothetical protein
VGGLHEVLEVIRGPVGALGGEGQHAVAAPVAPARKLGERHQLYRRHAELDQVVELFFDTGEGSLGGEGTDVQLVEHDLLPGASLSVLVSPNERSGIDHLARPVHVLGLTPGGGVWHLLFAVYAEAVARACPGFGGEGEGAVLFAGHRDRVLSEDEIHRCGGGRPQDESRPSVSEHLGAERHLVGSPQSASSSTVSRLR